MNEYFINDKIQYLRENMRWCLSGVRSHLRRWGRDWHLGMVLGACLAMVVLATGCRLIQGAADLPGHAVRIVLPGDRNGEGVDLVGLQESLMRFSDEFAGKVVLTMNQLRIGTNAPPPSDILKWKIYHCSTVWQIASGQSALVNLLDMTVVVTLVRLTVENYWMPEVYGESARPMLEQCRQSEESIWRIASTVLNPAQQEELRTAILESQKSSPNPESVLSVRAFSFLTSSVKGGNEPEAESGSVFGLLMIDPLAGLSPATQELTQTRLFGERTLFTLQRMPTILRWQTELAGLNAAKLPQVEAMVANATALSEAAQRVSRVAEALPDRLAGEREKIVAALEAQRPGLTALAAEAHAALEAGSLMASNVNLALTTFDGVSQHLEVGTRHTNAEPFRIQEYTEALREGAATAQQLAVLLQNLDSTLASTNLRNVSFHAESVLGQVTQSTQIVLDHTFKRAVQLVAIGCGLLLVVLVFSRIAVRWFTWKRGSGAPGS